ncbi:MAG: sugar nucleotide-binding protein [Nitrospirae bacterium]|nr:sugar nucleotide-binding protein [Nitrospirota bacterium]
MKILIVGASGFIGRHIYTCAMEKGYYTVGTACSGTGSDLVHFDILNDSIENAIPADFLKAEDYFCAVICSAITKINMCWQDKQRSYEINVSKTIRLIENLNALGAKTVFLSSEAVFDGMTGYYNEAIPPSPVNEYGRHKVEVEKYILSTFPQKDIVFRLSMIVGDRPSESHLFATWYEQVRKTRAIACIRGQIFSPTFVDDVAKGVILSLENKLSGLYHLSNSEFFQREELAAQFLNITKLDAQIQVKALEEFNFPERRSFRTYLDSTKFNKEAFMRFTSMREVLESFAGNIT